MFSLCGQALLIANRTFLISYDPESIGMVCVAPVNDWWFIFALSCDNSLSKGIVGLVAINETNKLMLCQLVKVPQSMAISIHLYRTYGLFCLAPLAQIAHQCGKAIFGMFYLKRRVNAVCFNAPNLELLHINNDVNQIDLAQSFHEGQNPKQMEIDRTWPFFALNRNQTRGTTLNPYCLLHP